MTTLVDARVRAVLDRPHSPAGQEGAGRGRFSHADPFALAGRPLSIRPEQGDLIYLLCRAIGATRVVDFATSVGVSAIYFAAVVRDPASGFRSPALPIKGSTELSVKLA